MNEVEISREKLLTAKINDKEMEIKVFNPLLCPFTVTRGFSNKGKNSLAGYPLRPGNIIKFGRVQYVVTEMKTNK